MNPGSLATRLLINIIQGAAAQNIPLQIALRNEAIKPYFYAVVVDIKADGAVLYSDEAAPTEPDDSLAAHKWFQGVRTAWARASGEFEAEVRAIELYLERRPETATKPR